MLVQNGKGHDVHEMTTPSWVPQIKRLMNSEKEEPAEEAQEILEPPEAPSQDPQEADGEPRIQAGCTAVVALLRGNELFVANAGDSRAILCRSGQAVPLSHDHKPASVGALWDSAVL